MYTNETGKIDDKGRIYSSFWKNTRKVQSPSTRVWFLQKEVKHMIKSLSAEQYALANEDANELVRFVLREESEVRQQSMMAWMAHEMIEEFVIPQHSCEYQR